MTSAPGAPRRVLGIEALSVTFRSPRAEQVAVRDVTIEVYPGEIVAIVGESGSGKSVTALSTLGLLPPHAAQQGRVEVDGLDVRSLGPERLRALRGARVAMVFQEPMTALNPAFSIGWQVAEALRVHDRRLSKREAMRRAGELLVLAGIRDAGRRLGQFPHELSGGLRQRVMIAIAIACDPKLLIADEATTALDVTVQAEILDLLRSIRDRMGTAVLVITHNMGVVADIADRVIVMKDGRVVEQASVDDLFERPQEPYTKRLLAAVPRLQPHPRGTRLLEEVAVPTRPGAAGSATPTAPRAPVPGAPDLRRSGDVLSVEHLTVEFGARATGRLRAVDDVSFSISPGEVLGLVGESGSGKSTVGKCIVGLVKPTSGRVRLWGEDLSAASGRSLKRLRRRCSVVFQDPGSSLDPRMTVAECVAEPLVVNRSGSRRSRDARVVSLLESVRLDADLRYRYPHELSGGQRQRVSIARALALGPELLVADEPTSALDVSVQATVLDLLLDLQAKFGFGCLFITHDLAVVSLLADRVAVMHSGRLVELGTRDEVLFNPKDPYTQRLVAAAPVPDPVEQRERRQKRLALAGGPGPGAEAGSTGQAGGGE